MSLRGLRRASDLLVHKILLNSVLQSPIVTLLQFLRAASHILGAHADALQPQSSTSSDSANEAEPPTATVPAPVSAATNVSATTGAFQWASRPPTGDQPVTRAQWNASG